MAPLQEVAYRAWPGRKGSNRIRLCETRKRLLRNVRCLGHRTQHVRDCRHPHASAHDRGRGRGRVSAATNLLRHG